jgi:ankyrin repeat protein
LIKLDASFDIPFSTIGGKTAFHIACEGGNERLLIEFINLLTNSDILNIKTKYGLTPFDILEKNDMNAMKKRLNKMIIEKGI